MPKVREKYLVDEQGRKTAIVLDLREYRQLVDRLKDLEDALDLNDGKQTDISFELRFDPDEIHGLACRYSDCLTAREARLESEIESQIAPAARARGYLLMEEFLAVCEWKSPRPRRHYCMNQERCVKDATREALAAVDGWHSIEVLDALRGVGPSVASAILHWMAGQPYPIWDFRALWSLGWEKPPACNRDSWAAYAQYCIDLAQKHEVSMRQLDRALWRYSKDNQPGKPALVANPRH